MCEREGRGSDSSGSDSTRRSGLRPRAHLLVHVDVRRRLDADDVPSLVAEHERGAVAEHLVALDALEDDEGRPPEPLVGVPWCDIGTRRDERESGVERRASARSRGTVEGGVDAGWEAAARGCAPVRREVGSARGKMERAGAGVGCARAARGGIEGASGHRDSRTQKPQSVNITTARDS